MHIGIIGCGKIAQVRHIPEYLERGEVELDAFYDVNGERAEALAKMYNGRAYASYQELLNQKEIEAVSICTANHSHAQIAVAALKAGKHVLCEKPMAMTLKDCEEMVQVSRETGKRLLIDHNQRLAKAHRKARELVVGGAIGSLISFETNFAHSGPETWSVDPGKDVWFFDKNKAVMGAMVDLGVHKTDLIQYLTGQRIAEVSAYMGALDKKDASGNLIGVDDNTFCIYRMKNGIVGTMRASWTCYGQEDNSTILYGTNGVMKIYSDPRYSLIIETRDGETIYYEMEKIQTNDNQTKSGVIDIFLEALTTNQRSDLDGEEALWAMRAIFAAVQSAKEGRTVAVAKQEET